MQRQFFLITIVCGGLGLIGTVNMLLGEQAMAVPFYIQIINGVLYMALGAMVHAGITSDRFKD